MKFSVHRADTYDTALKGEFAGTYSYVFLASILFLLMLLHTAFYLYDRTKRANIYFAAYALFNSLSFAIVSALPLVTQMPLMLILNAVTFSLNLISAAWLTEALQTLYGYRFQWLRIALWGLLTAALVVLPFNSLLKVFGFALLIFEIVQIGLNVKALRDRRRGPGSSALHSDFRSLSCFADW